jgi:hypothetical protein
VPVDPGVLTPDTPPMRERPPRGRTPESGPRAERRDL